MTSLDKIKLLSGFIHSGCSHNMVQRYYQDSIKNRDDSNNFLSKRCESYEKFKDNDCYGDELQMGEPLDTENYEEGKYFLDTNEYQDDADGTLHAYSKT